MSHQSELISTDINAYLAQHERKDLVRLLTCGSVDDGKSTLIGRLLHDSQLIYEDQLAAVKADSLKSGTRGGEMDLALLVDGLQAEREQGITIDVAYRYFSTAKRKFIIADTPGHEQYTRNMATGASTCDLAVILIDARHGVLVQTKRHSFIASLLGIRHILVAVNKMDLVDFRREVFENIEREYMEFFRKLNGKDIRFIPISALNGDNVVHRSANMPWYSGSPLMEVLESVKIASDRNFTDVRFPVQYVNRPSSDFRGFSGTLAAGVIRRGDAISVLPSGKSSRIQSIVTYDGELDEAFPPMAVTLTLEDQIDVSRGDMIVRSDNPPAVDKTFDALVVWMTETPMTKGKLYDFKQAARIVTGSIATLHHRIDINTLEQHAAGELHLNEIGLCQVMLNAPIAFDPYRVSKGTGAFIVIDRLTNVTIGAGMIAGRASAAMDMMHVTARERAVRFGQTPVTLWLAGSRNDENARLLERRLFDRGHACAILGDPALAARAKEVADVIKEAGLLCLCTLIPPPRVADDTNVVLDTDEMSTEAITDFLCERGYLT